jgi:hypothetical protein
VLAVNLGEGPGKVAAWVRDRNVSVDVLLDAGGGAGPAWRVTATPTTFIVGRDGRLRARAIGPKAWTSTQGRALLEALLAQ